MQFSVILIMILVLIVTVFTVVNAAPVTLNLVFTKVEISLALVILISALVGAFILFLIGLFDARKKSSQRRELESEITKLKHQVSVLEKEKLKTTEENKPSIEMTENNEIL